jgi:hypothetical protein
MRRLPLLLVAALAALAAIPSSALRPSRDRLLRGDLG